MKKTNRKYKDKVFCLLFGKEEYKENLLSLYNALNDSEYTNLDYLTINTIDDVIYVGYKNDVSFICEAENIMSLYEHQSTFNPNIPLRGVFYFSKLYEKYMADNMKDLYKSVRIKIPTPKFYVFYNGRRDVPDKTEFKLSSMYSGKGDLECTATMLNINQNHNKELLRKCRTLFEYSTFVEKVYQYTARCANIKEKQEKEKAVLEAVDRASRECIEEGILKDFLLSHRAEVRDVILTEYDENLHMQVVAEEAQEEAREKLLLDLVREGKLSAEDAAEKQGVSVEEFKEKL